MPSLTIAFLLERHAPTRGGMERYAEALRRWLEARGHCVLLVTGEVAEEPAPGTELHAVRLHGHRLLSRAEQLEAAARALSPDLLLDFGAGLGGDVLLPLYGERRASRRAAQAALPLGQRLGRVASRQWRRRQRALDALQQRHLANPACHVVACSRLVGEGLRRRGLPDERMSVIHNAVDSEAFHPADEPTRRAARASLGLPPEAPLFLQVAQNFDLKNLAASLEALRRLRSGGHAATLAVLGRGDRERWQARAAALGIADAVTFLGALPDSRPAYAAADALLHSSWYDPCSLAALEALACGLPPVLSRRDGAAELLGEGVQGFPVAPDDPGAIALAMKQLLDPGLRGAMAAQARVLAVHLDREQAFLRLEALMQARASARSR